MTKHPFFGTLREEDYAIHINTGNHSFLKMFKHLKDVHVKNNKFFLKLYDETLKFVDPHGRNLTLDTQNRILAECVKNPWYYLREVVRIPGPGGASKFELHRGNLAAIWAILNNFNPILLLPRQRGKTMAIAAILSWIYDFGTTNSQMLFSNKSLSDASNNLKRLKDIRGLHPKFFISAIYDIGDTDNVESIVSVRRNNSIRVFGAPNGAEAADRQGRGMSTPILWKDEFAFLKFNSLVYKSAAPAQSKIAEVAKLNGKPFSKIITTTPNNLDSESGAFCYSMINDACEFTEELYDMSKEMAERYITNNSLNDFLYIKFTWQQLGLSKEWYTKECRSLANDSLTIKREIDLVWTKSADNSVFNEQQLDIISENILDTPLETVFLSVFSNEKDSIDGEIFEKYPMKIYKKLIKERRYFIGVDTGGGTSNDFSAFTVVDRDTLEPCAIFKNNKINTAYFTSILEYLIKKHLPNSILVIERNSYGKAVIDQLLRKVPNSIFYDYPVSDKNKTKIYSKSDNIKFGIDTTSTTRDAMIDLLFQIVDGEYENLQIKEIYDEVRTLVYNTKGKVEHEKNCHDDVLFSYLFVRYVFKYSNSLNQFLRDARSIMDNTEKTIKLGFSSGLTLNKTLKDVNRNEKITEVARNLSLEEIIDLKTNEIDIVKYLKEKNQGQKRKRELSINKSTVTMMKGNKK